MRSEEVETSTRHQGPDRAFHWAMALSVIVLCATAFLPMLGIRFDWVPIHWIAGLVLVALILFHLARVVFVHGVGEMTPGSEDLREIAADVTGRSAALKPAKYDAYQKGYHWSSALVLLALVCGMLFMAALVLGPVVWATGTFVPLGLPWGPVEWSVIAMVAANAVAYSLFIHVVSTAGPVFASQTAYTVTIAGVLWGMAIFGEQHSLWIWASLALMLGGLALVSPRR